MNSNKRAFLQSHEPGFLLVKRGKVRELYRCGDPDQYLLITTDRISAFDEVLPTAIPEKGIVLTQMSNEWFRQLQAIAPNHLISPAPLEEDWEFEHLHGRSVLVRRAEPLPVKAVVRGYLAGSAWTEYQATGSVGGHRLPPGLKESDALPQPIFIARSKAFSGQRPAALSMAQMQSQLGANLAAQMVTLSLAIYKFAADYVTSRGMILADTKLEFGLCNGKMALIDEMLTPDCSRYWDRNSYKPGQPQPGFDKHFVREHLCKMAWDRRSPAPALPPQMGAQISERYLEALRRIFPECYEERMLRSIRTYGV